MVALKAKDPKKAEPKKPKILIFGKPGVGKTWGALDFPACYFIDCEGGAALDHYTDKLVKAGGVYMGPEDGANDMNVVVDQVRALATTKHNYKTLVIDSLSKLFNTRIAEKVEVMEQANTDMDKTFGREKKPAINALRQMVTWFDKLDMNVVFVCHEKDVWSDGKVIGQTFDAWEKLEYELHLCLRIVKQGTTRKAIVSKNRLKQFKDGESFPWSYEEFASRYGKSVMETSHVAIEPAAPAQAELVAKLADAVKLSQDDRVAWFEKAGVSSWAEMDAATCQKCIDHLKAKLPTAAQVA